MVDHHADPQHPIVTQPTPTEEPHYKHADTLSNLIFDQRSLFQKQHAPVIQSYLNELS
jgi:hypothetical protein